MQKKRIDMVHKWIERAMMSAAVSPIVISPLYGGNESLRYVENAIKPYDTVIALFGVFGTIIALFVLIYSLQKQDSQHKEHLKEIRQQFITQMSQIIDHDRESYLENYIAAAANNVHYYRYLNVSKGIFQFGHNQDIQDNFCVVFWNMRYKYMLEMDENYIFDLHFKIYSIKEIFGKCYNPENIDKAQISSFVRDEISSIHNKTSYWDFKISIPRFEGDYGKLAGDRNFSGMSRAEIYQIDPFMFACIGDAMAEIQVMGNFEMIEARNSAIWYNL